MRSCSLVALVGCWLAAQTVLGQEPPVPMRALVLEPVADPTAVGDWHARNASRLGGLAGRLQFSPGYPLALECQQVPGLGQAGYCVLAGFCRGDEQPAFASLREHFPGAYLRNVRLPAHQVACPLVLLQPRPPMPLAGGPADLPDEAVEATGLYGLAPASSEPPALEEADDLDGDPMERIALDPRASVDGLRFGRHGPSDLLRAMFPEFDAARPVPGAEGRVIERVDAVAGDFLALGEDSPNSTGPALAVLVFVVERYDGAREIYPELVVLAERAGRLEVLARLDRDELDVFDDAEGQVELQLGKLELAPGRAAIELIRQQRYRDQEVQETTRELVLYLIDEQVLVEVVALELLQEERSQEHVNGRLLRYQSTARGRLQVDPRMVGGLYRLVLTVRETETEDGKRVSSESQREVLCFDGVEYAECEE